MHYKNIIILKKVVPFQSGGQMTDFYFPSFRFWPKFWKKQNKTKQNKKQNKKTKQIKKKNNNNNKKQQNKNKNKNKTKPKKNTFPKELLNEIWLKVGERE